MTSTSYFRAAACWANQTLIRACDSGSESPRLTRSASSRPQPVMMSTIWMICSWKTTTPYVSRSGSSRSGCG